MNMFLFIFSLNKITRQDPTYYIYWFTTFWSSYNINSPRFISQVDKGPAIWTIFYVARKSLEAKLPIGSSLYEKETLCVLCIDAVFYGKENLDKTCPDIWLKNIYVLAQKWVTMWVSFNIKCTFKGRMNNNVGMIGKSKQFSGWFYVLHSVLSSKQRVVRDTSNHINIRCFLVLTAFKFIFSHLTYKNQIYKCIPVKKNVYE